MDLLGNAEQRQDLWAACKNDPDLQARVMALCAQSFKVWCCLFAWTYVVFEVKETGERVAKTDEKDVPFILWPTQMAAFDEMDTAWRKGDDSAVQKSREMGASWLVLAWFVWLAIFHGSELGVASRKEDLVEKTGNPDALFTKIDYLIDCCPVWMTGEVTRTSLLRQFQNGGTIAGESTNNNAYRGGRKQLILLDEASAMEGLAAILRSCKDAGPVVMVATHEPASHFLEVVQSGRCVVITLGWWDHPDKGRGREMIVDPATGGVDWTSPWMRLQELKRPPADLALNVRIDPSGGGKLVFDLPTINRQIALYARPAVYVGDVRFLDGVTIDPDLSAAYWPVKQLDFVDEHVNGRLRLWCDLIEDDDGRFRPDQTHDFALGIDIGDGVGASPSVISIVETDTGEKIGMWKSNLVSPESFAPLVWMLAHFIGGRHGVPVIVPEANGGRGTTVIGKLKAWKYPRLYRHIEPLKKGKKKADRFGWYSNRARKKAQLAFYSTSLFSGEFKNPDKPALEQARSYVYFDDGSVGPPAHANLSDEQQAEHGDDVIADMLGDLGRSIASKILPVKTEPRKGTVAWHIKRRFGGQKRDPWTV